MVTGNRYKKLEPTQTRKGTCTTTGSGTIQLKQNKIKDIDKVGICLSTLLSRSHVEWTSRNKYNTNFLDYPSPTIASAIAQGQLAYYTSLNESEELFTIETSGQLQNHVSKWKNKTNWCHEINWS